MSNYAETVGDLPLALQDTEAPADELSSKANWGAVAALTLGVFGLVTSEFLPISILTPMAADLGVSVSAAGQAVTATAVVAIAAALLTSVLTKTIDRRIVIQTLVGSLVVSSLIAATASSYTALLIARVLLGIGLGGFWSMVGATALRLVPASSVPRAMSIIFAGVSAATVCAAPLGAYIGDVWGWRTAFYLSAIIGAVALAIQIITMPRLAPKSVPSFGSMFSLLLRPQIALGFTALVLLISGQFSGFTYIRPFLEVTPQFGVEAISLTLLAFGVAGFLGTLIAGQLLARSVRLNLAVGAFAISGVMLALALFGSSAIASVATVTVWGIAFGLVPVGFQTWAVKTAPDDAEAVGGLMVAAFQVAITTGAALGGVFMAGFGVSGPIIYAMVVALAAALIISSYRGFSLRAG